MFISYTLGSALEPNQLAPPLHYLYSMKHIKIYKMIEMYEERQTLYVVYNTLTKTVQSVWSQAKDAKDTVAALNIGHAMWKVA